MLEWRCDSISSHLPLQSMSGFLISEIGIVSTELASLFLSILLLHCIEDVLLISSDDRWVCLRAGELA